LVSLNILVINDTAHLNGGAAKLAIAEALGLADRGHSVLFLAAVRPIDEVLGSHPNIRVVCTEQFDLLADPNRLRAFLQGWWNRKAYQTAKSIARSLEPKETMVHLHIWSRALSSSVTRAVLDAGLPTVCTLHDFLLACPTGSFFLHHEQKVCTLKPMSRACITANCDARTYSQKLWRVGRQVIQQRFGHAPSHLKDYIVHSRLVAETMTPYLPQNARLYDVPVYIEAEKTPPANPELNHAFVYLGRLVAEKGVVMLARSAAAEGLDVTFVGSGPLDVEVRAANPAAVITGWADKAACVGHLRQARALVFPSLWYETLGLVVLEAAAQGIPSIVPDSGAARETVEDGVTGLHFRGGDEDDLRAKMRQLNDPQLAARLGRAAYERFWAGRFHSLEAHVRDLEQTYEKVLRRSWAEGAHPDSESLVQLEHSPHRSNCEVVQ
jgi:glycosyltransferase involved in cell wall biosynthesis